MRHRTACSEALEKATAEMLKADTALATARAAVAKAATEEHQAKDLVQKAADAYRKMLPGPEGRGGRPCFSRCKLYSVQAVSNSDSLHLGLINTPTQTAQIGS